MYKCSIHAIKCEINEYLVVLNYKYPTRVIQSRLKSWGIPYNRNINSVVWITLPNVNDAI